MPDLNDPNPIESTPPAPPAGDPPAPPSEAPPASAEPPARPEGVPDEYWDHSAGLKVGEMVSGLTEARTRIAELEELRGQVPDKAESYELALPADFQVEEGFTVDFDPKDPALAVAQETALALGTTNAEWQKALKIEAARQVAEQKRARELAGAEVIKLGERARERTAAVKNWIGANLPGPSAEYLLSTPFSAAQIEAFEAIQQLAGGPEMPGGGPAPTPPAPTKDRAERWYGANDAQGT